MSSPNRSSSIGPISVSPLATVQAALSSSVACCRLLPSFAVRAVLIALAMLSASPAHADETIAITNVNVVPMDRDRVLLRQTVLIRDGRIEVIGRRLRLPDNVRIVDGRNRWLSPGLMDMHVHSDTREDLAVYLANGITTIVNMGDARAEFVARIAPAANTGRVPGPRVYNAFIVDGTPEYAHFFATTPAQAEAAVSLARSNGYRFIKVYNNLEPEVFVALANAARREHLPLVGHGVTRVGLREQAEAGQVLVAHAEEFFYTFFSGPMDEQTDTPPPQARIAEAVAFARQFDVAVGADLVTYSTICGQIGHPEILDALLTAPTAAYVSPADRLEWRRSGYIRKTADLRAKYAFLQAMLRAMDQAGVELLSGTDAPSIPGLAPGFSLHANLLLLESAGLSRFQALATATRNPGRFLSRKLGEPRSGVLVAGARADMVLTEGNPLLDLKQLQRPSAVIQNGRWHDALGLGELLANVADAYRSIKVVSGRAPDDAILHDLCQR